MEYVVILFRWLHIFGAIILVGGTIFMRYAVVPAEARLAGDQRLSLSDAVRGPWAALVMLSSALLLLSGIVNLLLIVFQFELPRGYHPLIGVKILIALPIFFIAARLTGRTEAAARFRQRSRLWLNINIVLAVLVVCLGGILRYMEREPKAAENPRVASSVRLANDE